MYLIRERYISIIENAIKEKTHHILVPFSDPRDHPDRNDSLYDDIEAYFWNTYYINVDFGCIESDMMVIISIIYPSDGIGVFYEQSGWDGLPNDRDVIDTSVDILYNYYKDTILDKQMEVPSLSMIGYLYPYVYYEVSMKLNKYGHRIILNNGEFILSPLK